MRRSNGQNRKQSKAKPPPSVLSSAGEKACELSTFQLSSRTAVPSQPRVVPWTQERLCNLELCHGPRRVSAQISSEPCPLRRTEWQSPSRKPLVSAVGKGRGTSSLLHLALKSQSSDLFEMPIRRLLGLSAAASGHLRRGLSTAAERPPWAMIYHAILDKSPG
jgi:hypothetical protein